MPHKVSRVDLSKETERKINKVVRETAKKGKNKVVRDALSTMAKNGTAGYFESFIDSLRVIDHATTDEGKKARQVIKEIIPNVESIYINLFDSLYIEIPKTPDQSNFETYGYLPMHGNYSPDAKLIKDGDSSQDWPTRDVLFTTNKLMKQEREYNTKIYTSIQDRLYDALGERNRDKVKEVVNEMIAQYKSCNPDLNENDLKSESDKIIDDYFKN